MERQQTMISLIQQHTQFCQGGGAKGTAVTFFPADAYTPDMIRMARAIAKAGAKSTTGSLESQVGHLCRQCGMLGPRLRGRLEAA